MIPSVFSVILLGALIAWWPRRMPRPVRIAGACLALAPVILALIGVSVMLLRRPGLVSGTVSPVLAALGMATVAGAYALWPREMPRRNRIAVALFFVGPLLGLFTAAEVFMYSLAGTVGGKVTFNGQPVSAGRVSILGDDGVVSTGVIRPDGRYTVYRVPCGPVKIAVATYPPSSGPVPMPSSGYVAIPQRYRDFEKSNLTRVITWGFQREDLELRP